MAGHGEIINLSNGLSLVFQFNPQKVANDKKANWVELPNIGGKSRGVYFTGFGNKEISFTLQLIDTENPMGVSNQIVFFEALSEPGTQWQDLASVFEGNANFPPPKVLFTFGTGSMIPLVYDVLSVGPIETDLFYTGHVRGVIGIPKRASVPIKLSLDEENILNKANWIAKKAQEITASGESINREVYSKVGKNRRERQGFWPDTSEVW